MGLLATLPNGKSVKNKDWFSNWKVFNICEKTEKFAPPPKHLSKWIVNFWKDSKNGNTVKIKNPTYYLNEFQKSKSYRIRIKIQKLVKQVKKRERGQHCKSFRVNLIIWVDKNSYLKARQNDNTKQRFL